MSRPSMIRLEADWGCDDGWAGWRAPGQRAGWGTGLQATSFWRPAEHAGDMVSAAHYWQRPTSAVCMQFRPAATQALLQYAQSLAVRAGSCSWWCEPSRALAPSDDGNAGLGNPMVNTRKLYVAAGKHGMPVAWVGHQRCKGFPQLEPDACSHAPGQTRRYCTGWRRHPGMGSNASSCRPRSLGASNPSPICSQLFCEEGGPSQWGCRQHWPSCLLW